MEIELRPDTDADDPAVRAALAALTREGFADDLPPVGGSGAWRRAGIEEAIDRSARNGFRWWRVGGLGAWRGPTSHGAPSGSAGSDQSAAAADLAQ